jgi:hypothetical protein
LKFQVEIEIQPNQIGDLICDAIEGGSEYWLHHFHDKTEFKGKGWYHNPKFWEQPEIRIEACFMDPENPVGQPAKKIITQADVERAVQQFARDYPSLFGDWIAENHDANTGDVFMQLIVLGAEVYG